MITRKIILPATLFETFSELISSWSTTKGDIDFRTFSVALTIREKDMLGFQAFRDKFRIFTKKGDFEIHKAGVSK